MTWISPFKMDMSISEAVLKSSSDYPIVETIQKIAIYTVIPFLLIAAFEAIVKNFICINLLNCLVTVLNASHNLYQRLWVHST